MLADIHYKHTFPSINQMMKSLFESDAQGFHVSG